MSQQLKIESELRKKILDLELLPGEKISERWAEQEFNISRTPIRAALVKLETEGLVEKEQRSWRITKLDIEDIKKLFEFREILEVSAINLIKTEILEKNLKEIETQILVYEHEKGTLEGTDKSTSIFHIELARLSNNNFLVNSLEITLQKLSRVRWLDNSINNSAWSDHIEIINALKINNLELAIELLTSHIRASRDRVLSVFDEKSKKVYMAKRVNKRFMTPYG